MGTGVVQGYSVTGVIQVQCWGTWRVELYYGSTGVLSSTRVQVYRSSTTVHGYRCISGGQD